MKPLCKTEFKAKKESAKILSQSFWKLRGEIFSGLKCLSQILWDMNYTLTKRKNLG